MIFGDCPYPDCDDLMVVAMTPKPGYERHECEGCGQVIWTRLGRWDPWSMTEADFLATHDVNQETKQVTKKEVRT